VSIAAHTRLHRGVDTRSALLRGLREAEERTLADLEMVRLALGDAVQAATTGDNALVADITARGTELDRRYGDVHEKLLALIALQAPVAGDLRLAMALLHVNDRIERMGAQCVNIATLCSAMSCEPPSSAQLDCLLSMTALAGNQVAEAGRTFAERDVDGAGLLSEGDVEINRHNRRCFALAVNRTGDESQREAAFFVALMARAIERIGDNAVDIGRQTIFAVTGRLRPATRS
jgi:phosphate transport system protein